MLAVAAMAAPATGPLELLLAHSDLVRFLEGFVLHKFHISSHENLPAARNVDPVCLRGFTIPKEISSLCSLIQHGMLLIWYMAISYAAKDPEVTNF